MIIITIIINLSIYKPGSHSPKARQGTPGFRETLFSRLPCVLSFTNSREYGGRICVAPTTRPNNDDDDNNDNDFE